MYCFKCGSEVAKGSTMCPKCWAPVETGGNMYNPKWNPNEKSDKQTVVPNENGTIDMRCEDCGGVMSVDRDRRTITCPYCGSKKMVAESEEVKLARIWKETELKKQRMEYEMEITKRQMEREEKNAEWKRKMEEKQKEDRGATITIICCIVFVIVLLIMF